MIAGAVVAERYRLERKLGEGGMGAVWAATHLVTRKRVAIKMLKPELAKNAALVERFLREARAACAVQHPNVVQIHDVLQMAEGVPLMVMDLLDGESLAERLIRDGRLSVPEFSRVMLKVLPAVAAAHAAQVVHRDLKPDNLFLCRTVDGAIDLRVLDFGIAKVSSTDAEAGVLTKTGSMLGTPFYMAPEQLFGEKDVDFRADIWSLGIIIYECLSGQRPTEATNLGQIIKLVTSTGIRPLESLVPHVPPDICHIVRRMLTSDRNARLTDLAEARGVFEQYAGMAPSRPPADGPSGHMKISSEGPLAPTGPTQWEAVAQQQPWVPVPTQQPKTGRWPIVAAAGGLLVAVTTLAVAVPRIRAITTRPTPSVPAPASVVIDGPSQTASVEPTTLAASATTPAPSLDADAGVATARTVRMATGAGRRPSDPRPLPPPPSSRAQPASPTSTSQGVLVEKPPF